MQRIQLIKFLIPAGFLILFGNVSLPARSICIPSELRVRAVHGKVVSSETAKGQEAMANALVELRKISLRRNGERVERTIKRVMTDGSGYFNFGEVSPGKYVIYASWPSDRRLTDFVFPVLVEKHKPNGSEAELVIALGFSFAYGGCHGSYAKYADQDTRN